MHARPNIPLQVDLAKQKVEAERKASKEELAKAAKVREASAQETAAAAATRDPPPQLTDMREFRREKTLVRRPMVTVVRVSSKAMMVAQPLPQKRFSFPNGLGLRPCLQCCIMHLDCGAILLRKG